MRESVEALLLQSRGTIRSYTAKLHSRPNTSRATSENVHPFSIVQADAGSAGTGESINTGSATSDVLLHRWSTFRSVG